MSLFSIQSMEQYPDDDDSVWQTAPTEVVDFEKERMQSELTALRTACKVDREKLDSIRRVAKAFENTVEVGAVFTDILDIIDA